MADRPIRVDDALTDIRKRDWQRLVRAAADGQRFELADDDLERSVLLRAPHPGSELVTSVTLDGRPRGAWMHGRSAAAFRGRLVALLLRQVLDGDDTEDDLMVATALALYTPTPTVGVEDLTAREGRRLLAEVARLDVGRWVITITHPYGPEHVVLGTEAAGEVASLVSVVDGDRVVGGGLYTHQQIETLLEVGGPCSLGRGPGRPAVDDVQDGRSTGRRLAGRRDAAANTSLNGHLEIQMSVRPWRRLC